MDEIQTTGSFPARLSGAKPADRPISAATARLYDLWNKTQDRTNPFCPDAFADNGDGQGVRRGLAHINPQGGGVNNGCHLIRFDCNLCDADRPEYQKSNILYDRDTWLQPVLALSAESKADILEHQAGEDR